MKILALWLVVSLLHGIFASDILESAKEIEEWIIRVRRELHRIPELGFDLQKTAKAVRLELEELDISYEYPVARTGIVAKIGWGTPVVALRADMDALPIQEPRGLKYASQHKGKMHACGHDAHTAILLGAARLLKDREGLFPGTVKLFFQPAEETVAGAKLMVKEGHLDDVSMAFGFHVWPAVESGIFQTRSGLVMAASNAFEVKVIGKGGHASSPHLVIDPMIPVANMILAYQTIISRSMSPLESHVISVTTINGGHAFNVIPDSITFGGTMRSLSLKGLDPLVSKFTKITKGIAKAYGCEVEVKIPFSVDPVVNDEKATVFATKVAQEMFGNEKVEKGNVSTGGEDFAYFAQKVPATFVYIGIHNKTVGSTAALHTTKFKVDEGVLYKGAALQVALAIEYLFGAAKKTEL